MPHIELNGIRYACLDDLESVLLSKDVGDYFELGLSLSPGDVVLDVGANIGLFSGELSRRLDGRVRILAFEPLPPIHRVLAENARTAMKGDVRTFEYGLGSREERLEFSFFPLMSCLSSAHRGKLDVDEEVARLARAIIPMIKEGKVVPWMAKLPGPFLEGVVEGYVKTRMKSERHQVRVRRLSQVIDEEALERIDLLKIDVEGAEEDVLAGVEERHWPRVKQLVLELERFEARIEPVRSGLAEKGFEVEAIQGEAQRAGDYGLVVAVRTP